MPSIKTNLFYNLFLNVSKVIFPLITAPYATRVLAANDLGLANFANTFSGYFALVAVLGVPFYGSREIAKVRDDKFQTNRLFCELFSISLLNTIFLTFIYLLSVLFINRLSTDYIVFLIAGVTLYCSPFNIDWLYAGIENFKVVTIRSIFIKTLSVISLFVFVRERNDFIIFLLINVFATVANDIWNFFVLYKLGYKVKFSFEGIKKHLKPLLILFSSTLAASIYTVLDVIMLGFMSVYSEVAYYTYAMHLVKALLAAITSLAAVAVPRVSYYIKNNKYEEINDLVNKSFSLVSFFALPMCIGIILISPTFIPLFLGEQFYGSIIPIQILSFILIFIGLNNLFAIQCLVGLGFDKLFFVSILSGTISNFALNLLLIPRYGAIGASVASSVAEFLVLFISAYFVVRFTSIKLKQRKDFIHTIVASLLLIFNFWIATLFLDGWGLIFIFIILSLISYMLYQYYVKNETLLIIIKLVTNKILRFEYV